MESIDFEDDWLDKPVDKPIPDDDWLNIDVRPAVPSGLESRAEIMRPGEQDGKDRIWWTDGEYVWFRRIKSNPATLKRHNDFVKSGDYRHVETQGDVEIYQLQPSSPFAVKKTVDIGQMDLYNIRRQAVKAACRRDWKGFRDIMSFLRERVNAKYCNPDRPGAASPLAENVYADMYMGVMTAIDQRYGPSVGEINRELLALAGKGGVLAQQKLITIGGS